MSKPFAITLDVGSSLANHTGSWRTERPVYVDRIPPCNNACPAGENIQAWLYHAESGDYHAAWKTLVENNPLPAIMGRACYHPCESACNRAQLDHEVNIHSVERFLGDEAIRRRLAVRGWLDHPAKMSWSSARDHPGFRRRITWRGSATKLAIYEAGPAAGGMMRFGIPKYRLPREILNAEIARIARYGRHIRLNDRVDDLAASPERQAIRRCLSRRRSARMPNAHIFRRAMPAESWMRWECCASVDGGEAAELGRRVLVYGGGNTALDVARTAKRLGATETLIVYRRTREKMPAHDFEVQEAIEEGIQFRWLSTIKEAGDSSFKIEKMRLDEKGFPQPTGDFETIEGDSLVLALGQDVDLSFLERVSGLEIVDGVVKVNSQMMTGHPGVFAGGDMVPAERTVTVAVGHGKKAARNIDAWLRGAAYHPGAKHELRRSKS